jgi:hypothetical protein
MRQKVHKTLLDMLESKKSVVPELTGHVRDGKQICYQDDVFSGPFLSVCRMCCCTGPQRNMGAPKDKWGPQKHKGPPTTQGAPKSQYLTLGGFLYIIHSIPNNCLAALIADSYLFQHN